MELINPDLLAQISALKSYSEQYVLKMRLGINAERPYSLQEIADKMGISRERVRQIQHKALSRLANKELNSMLLLAEVVTPSKPENKMERSQIQRNSNSILRDIADAKSIGGYVIVTFSNPTLGVDPQDGMKFRSERHKVKADWVKQDGQETQFVLDGEIVASWSTNSITGITWPTGENIPTTPVEFRNRMEEIKANFPKAWSKWSYEEDQKLAAMFMSGKKVSEIASHLRRAPGGIFSRLRKMNLIAETSEFSENLTYKALQSADEPSKKNPIRTGTVYELIRDLYQIDLLESYGDKLDPKFGEKGWFVLTDQLFRCTDCHLNRIIVLRKHWKNMGRVFHRWSITCLECKKTGESRDFDEDMIDQIHEKLEHEIGVESICPNCNPS